MKVNRLFALFVAELLSILRKIRRPTEFSTDKGLGSTSWRVNLDIPIVFRVANIFPMFHSEDTFRSIFLALVIRLETRNAFSSCFLQNEKLFLLFLTRKDKEVRNRGTIVRKRGNCNATELLHKHVHLFYWAWTWLAYQRHFRLFQNAVKSFRWIIKWLSPDRN